jgi:signal transduction histidine kinase
MEAVRPTYEDLLKKIEHLQYDLEEAKDTIEAIRTGQVDALIVDNGDGHELYTLKSADQNYRIFIEQMSEGAITVNKQGLIIYSNSQFARMMNKKLSDILGANLSDFIGEHSLNSFKKLFVEGWEIDCKGEHELNNDAKTCAQLSLSKLKLEDGEYLSIIITDLTRLKDNERLLAQQNKELEESNIALEMSNNDLMQFASVASHDLQEPLRKIMVFMDLFSKTGTDDISEQAKGYLDKIRSSSERMKQLIIDILNYSRLSAKDSIHEEVDLNLLIKDVVQDYEITIQEKNATIHYEGLPCFVVNKGQIRQVFQNIISNALKFSKPGMPAEIIITAAHVSHLSFNAPEVPDANYCKITIKDNGIGFDDTYVQNVFSLFERLNPKDKYEGSGIGMSIAKKIIEKHKGLITAHSHEGDGAEFVIILPIKQ